MRRFILFSVLLMFAVSLKAQGPLYTPTNVGYSFVLGGAFAPESIPHTTGSFTVDTTFNDAADFLSFTAQARGPQEHRFMYSYTMGAKHRIAQKGRFSMYGDVKGGGAISATAAGGIFATSGSVEWALNKNLSVIFAGGLSTSPIDDGTRPQAGIYIRLTP